MRQALALAGLLSVAAHPALAQPLPPGVPPVEERKGTASAEEVLELLSEWLPGTYDNREQLGTAGDWGAESPELLTTRFVPVELPALAKEGARDFFLEEYSGARAETLVRVRIYRAMIEDGRVTVHLLNPVAPEAWRGASQDRGRLAAMTPENIQPDTPACTLVLEKPGATIIGRMRSRACKIRDLWVDYEWHIGRDAQAVCYSRRRIADDAIVWQQMPPLPCVEQDRTRFPTTASSPR